MPRLAPIPVLLILCLPGHAATPWTAAWTGPGGSAVNGGVSSTTRYSSEPSLAFDPAGRPAVAWQESTGSTTSAIYFRQWDGSSWVELGGSANGAGVSQTSGRSRSPSLAFDGLGRPVIAWEEFGASSYIYAKRWNGSAWVELGGSATGMGVSGVSSAFSSLPSLAVDAGGNPSIAWQYRSWYDPREFIHFRRWSGSAWVELDGSGTGSGLGEGLYPTMDVDGAGNPGIAWQAGTQIHFRRWTGSAWTELAGSATGGGVSTTATGAWFPSMKFDPSDRPAIAWGDSGHIHLRRWDGSTWSELAGSASGAGVSGAADDSDHPSLAIDPAGNPCVAWRQGSPAIDPGNVLFARWNGTAWIEQAGSLTGSGVTDAGGTATNPCLALDALGNPGIAWVHDLSGNEPYITDEIHFKQCIADSGGGGGSGSGGGSAGGSSSSGSGGGCSAGVPASGSAFALLIPLGLLTMRRRR